MASIVLMRGKFTLEQPRVDRGHHCVAVVIVHAATVRQRIDRFRQAHDLEGERQFIARLCTTMRDVSGSMQRLEQLFTQWYNRHHRRHGTPWEELFKSVPVEGAGETLATTAAYIDLTPSGPVWWRIPRTTGGSATGRRSQRAARADRSGPFELLPAGRSGSAPCSAARRSWWAMSSWTSTSSMPKCASGPIHRPGRHHGNPRRPFIAFQRSRVGHVHPSPQAALYGGGGFEDFILQTVGEAGLIHFVDTLNACGTLYQVVRAGP